MRMIVEQLVEWNLAGETEVLGENLLQRHSVHHKIPLQILLVELKATDKIDSMLTDRR
jgi:hypothetical protein